MLPLSPPVQVQFSTYIYTCAPSEKIRFPKLPPATLSESPCRGHEKKMLRFLPKTKCKSILTKYRAVQLQTSEITGVISAAHHFVIQQLTEAAASPEPDKAVWPQKVDKSNMYGTSPALAWTGWRKSGLSLLGVSMPSYCRSLALVKLGHQAAACHPLQLPALPIDRLLLHFATAATERALCWPQGIAPAMGEGVWQQSPSAPVAPTSLTEDLR